MILTLNLLILLFAALGWYHAREARMSTEKIIRLLETRFKLNEITANTRHQQIIRDIEYVRSGVYYNRQALWDIRRHLKVPLRTPEIGDGSHASQGAGASVKAGADGVTHQGD